MDHKMRNMLLGAAGAVFSAALIREGVSMEIDRRMVGEALDRQEPRAMGRIKARIRGYADDEQTIRKLREEAGKLEAAPHEVISINGYDGTELRGHLFRAENPKRVILAMHGWRSGWSRDFGMASDFFRRNDCTVLYAEQRGQGESGGAHMGFGMIERFDCLEWIRWLNASGFRELPIYLAGISMGATTVLMTAGFPELPENVAGVLADCGFTSAKEEWHYISETNLHIPFRRRQRHMDSLCRKRIALASDAYSTLDAMRTCKTPVLFIHGREDRFVPMEMTLENYEACRAPKRLLIVDGANHGMSYLTAREEYEAAVKTFWEEWE